LCQPMAFGELIESLPSLPREWEHIRYGVLDPRVERDVAGRISGRVNAVLGVTSCSLLRAISEATCGRGDVYLIHPSDEILNVLMDAVRSNGLTNVDVRRAPLHRLPAENRAFDTVFFLLQLHHEGDPIIALREAKRVLRTDGRVVILEAAGRPGSAHSISALDVPAAKNQIETWLSRAGLRVNATSVTTNGFRIRKGSEESSYDPITVEAVVDAGPPTE